ncbi:hypothetical protein [Streptomyces collinus]|uniref:hypothetical protein n=1 Tax=Streptomyces collinus TaxID=42684 RepID=UPI0036A71FF9
MHPQTTPPDEQPKATAFRLPFGSAALARRPRAATEEASPPVEIRRSCDLGGDRGGVGPAEVRAQLAGPGGVPVAGRHDGAE